MSYESLTGAALGSAVGLPELGAITGGLNTASKAIVDATGDIPVVGDVTKAVEGATDAIKDIPVLGDALDLIF